MANKTSTAAGTLFTALAAAFLSGCAPEKEHPIIAMLEREVRVYTAQIDSLQGVVDEFSARIKNLSAQVDTTRAANRMLLASLQKVTEEMKEYRRLYGEQKALSEKLRIEVGQLRSERDRSAAQARQLKAQVDSLDNELYIQRARVSRLEAKLWESLERQAEAEKALVSVLVYTGTQEGLQEEGFLDVRQATIFTDAYKLAGFPDLNDSRVKRAAIEGSLMVDGEVRFLVDRHGKLKKHVAYRMSY